MQNFTLIDTSNMFFLQINVTFLTNMWWQYFSFNFCRVFHHSKVEFSDLDQNWARNMPFLFKTFKLPNSMAWHIVQCVFMQKNQWKGSNIQIQCFYNGTSGAPCSKHGKTEKTRETKGSTQKKNTGLYGNFSQHRGGGIYSFPKLLWFD